MKKFLVLLSLCYFSCSEENHKTVDAPSENIEILKQQVQVQKETTVNLLPEAEEEIMKWTAFVKTKSAIEQLDNYSLKEIRLQIDNIIRVVTELQSHIPQDLRKPPIEARIRVIFTKAKILQQLLKDDSLEVKKINQVAGSLASEFEYLKIQINEAFLESPVDFEIDLKKMEVQKDSVTSRVAKELPEERELLPLEKRRAEE